MRLTVLALAFSLAGCGGVALNHSFNDYSDIYANITDRQLLLNLARVANSHPPHFLQLGLINTTYSFGTSGSVNASNTTQDSRNPVTGTGLLNLVARIWTWGLGAGGSVSEQPTFSLTPLSGPQFAQGFLASVPAAVFFTLLEQGEPIDQLLRILVQSIEFAHPDGDYRVTLINSPSVDDAELWVQFLRVAAICLELQRRQLLLVATVPVPSAPTRPYFEKPTLDQALKALEKGMVLFEAAPGQFALGSVSTATTLKLAPRADALIEELARNPQFRVDALAPPRGTSPAPDKRPMTMTIRLRSFFAILSQISKEEAVYDVLTAQPGFIDRLPPSQRQPVIRLTWDGAHGRMTKPLVQVDYVGRRYAIADRPGETWNREVFTLLSYIESQVSLDPKALPVQQLINVR
jgi:hypothetical protein